MSADSPNPADLISRFAELVDRVDGEGVTIVDYDTDRMVNSGDLQGTIDLRIDDVPANDEDPVEIEEVDHDAEEIIDELEDDQEDVDEAPADAAATPEAVDQEDVGVPMESDVAPADIDDEDEQDADETDDELPRPGAIEEETESNPLIDEIVSILESEGELRSSTLRDRVDGNRTDFYDAADELKEADRLSVRDDPNDGRRKLYSLADVDGQDDQDEPVWNGEDPETIVADSSLPARIVLDDILDAAGPASTVIEMAESLDVDVNNLEPVCWQLTLKKPDSLEIVDAADKQVETIREVTDGE